MVESKPWDQRLLERMQRGNDRVTTSPWVRLTLAILIVASETLNLAHLSPPAAVFWPLWSVLLLVFIATAIARLRDRR